MLSKIFCYLGFHGHSLRKEESVSYLFKDGSIEREAICSTIDSCPRCNRKNIIQVRPITRRLPDMPVENVEETTHSVMGNLVIGPSLKLINRDEEQVGILYWRNGLLRFRGDLVRAPALFFDLLIEGHLEDYYLIRGEDSNREDYRLDLEFLAEGRKVVIRVADDHVEIIGNHSSIHYTFYTFFEMVKHCLREYLESRDSRCGEYYDGNSDLPLREESSCSLEEEFFSRKPLQTVGCN